MQPNILNREGAARCDRGGAPPARSGRVVANGNLKPWREPDPNEPFTIQMRPKLRVRREPLYVAPPDEQDHWQINLRPVADDEDGESA
jgi:hypothetical protein